MTECSGMLLPFALRLRLTSKSFAAVVEGYGKHMKDLSHDQAIKAFRV